MWRFKGTHVPATLLFENLEDGATVNDFLDWYPGVTREQVLAVLAFAERSLIEVWIGRHASKSLFTEANEANEGHRSDVFQITFDRFSPLLPSLPFVRRLPDQVGAFCKKTVRFPVPGELLQFYQSSWHTVVRSHA
jgi:Protein of unknown function (DUF433)